MGSVGLSIKSGKLEIWELITYGYVPLGKRHSRWFYANGSVN